MSTDEWCLSIIGVLIAGPAVGCIYGAAYGCLTIGCGLLGIALLSRMFTLAILEGFHGFRTSHPWNHTPTMGRSNNYN